MENKFEVFFGENGLTSTSANYIANKGKEYIRTIEEKINNISFVSKGVKSIMNNGTNLDAIITIGSSEDDAREIVADIRKIVEIKSLIAWLREAIKARNCLNDDINRKSFAIWMDEQGYENKVSPTMEPVMTEDTYLATLSVKERNEYYEAETKAAVIGKLIHSELAPISKARKNLVHRMSNPIDVVGEGQDALIYSYVPSIKIDDVDKIFFGLQEEYREAQAQVNSMKYKMETAINNDKTEKYNKYQAAYNEYSTYLNNTMKEFNEWKRLEGIKVSALKIIIPNDLKETYEFVKSL